MIFQQINLLPIEAIITIAFILGLCIGSFLNVVIIRLPAQLMSDEESVLKEVANEYNYDLIRRNINIDNEVQENQSDIPSFLSSRSQCISCKKLIKWYDNIPMLSYLLLKGQCRYCKASISIQYFIVEWLTGLLFALAAYTLFKTNADWVSYILSFTLISVFIALACIDFAHKLLPDQLTLPLVWLGLIANTNQLFTTTEHSIWGACIGYLAFWSLYKVHFFMTKREGMGYGDFKLTAAIGAWFGVFSLPYIMLCASISGIFYYIYKKIFVKNNESDHQSKEIPFGPFLIFGALGYFFLKQSFPYYLMY